MSWHGWVSLLAALVALTAVGLAVQNRRWLRSLSLHHNRATAAPPQAPVTRRRVAFVANPTKPGAADLRERVTLACAARDLDEPLWYETTAADPGVGQARRAVADGAQVVVAAGGDGTVRAVAEGVTGTGVAMALLPLGTGNLLARNLDLPLGDVEAQLRIALGGQDRAIDVGWHRAARRAGHLRPRRRAGPDRGGPRAHLPERRLTAHAGTCSA